jgi:hypothetical protein
MVEILLLVLCVLAAMAISVRACAADARRRGQSPLLISMLVVVLFPVGWVLWMIFRPKLASSARDGI